MALVVAEKQIKDLMVLSPDIPAYELMNSEIEKVASRYAPVWENDRSGNLYLNITGTAGLFGPPVDYGSRILRDIFDKAEIRPAAAVACNKLVSKVATRVIRPTGLMQVHNGTEAEFLSHQDIRVLPGMGPKLLRIAAITGIREIGELASLPVNEAVSIFGKLGTLLRNMAQGIDGSRVEGTGASMHGGERKITRQADFNEDTADIIAIRGALETLAEHGGLQMRNEKLGMRTLRLVVKYSDGVEALGFEKKKRLLITDSEISQAAFSLYKRTANRRIRIRSIGLSFEDLTLLSYQPDLFEPVSYAEPGYFNWIGAPEAEVKSRKLQEAVDKIQNRYGAGAVMRGPVLAAMSLTGRKRLIAGETVYV